MVQAHIPIILAIVLFIGWASPSFAQVYKWRDKDGNLRFSDTPPPPGVEAEKVKMREAPQRSSQKGSPESER
jgi:hypothetical protein